MITTTKINKVTLTISLQTLWNNASKDCTCAMWNERDEMKESWKNMFLDVYNALLVSDEEFGSAKSITSIRNLFRDGFAYNLLGNEVYHFEQNDVHCEIVVVNKDKSVVVHHQDINL